MHRESPTGRVIIVIVAERGERRQEREERRERERRKREREGKRDPPPPHLTPSLLSVCRLKNVSVCRFKTHPAKRIRQNARMCSTCGRLASTHGCVLNLHTETFLTYTRGVFRVPSRATHRQHSTHHFGSRVSSSFLHFASIVNSNPRSRNFSSARRFGRAASLWAWYTISSWSSLRKWQRCLLHSLRPPCFACTQWSRLWRWSSEFPQVRAMQNWFIDGGRARDVFHSLHRQNVRDHHCKLHCQQVLRHLPRSWCAGQA